MIGYYPHLGVWSKGNFCRWWWLSQLHYHQVRRDSNLGSSVTTSNRDIYGSVCADYPLTFSIIFLSSGISTAEITIVTYGLLNRPSCRVVQEALMNQGFNFVILDESHYMKNWQTRTTKYLVPLLQKAEHKILLTGTPALSRPIEVRWK